MENHTFHSIYVSSHTLTALIYITANTVVQPRGSTTGGFFFFFPGITSFLNICEMSTDERFFFFQKKKQKNIKMSTDDLPLKSTLLKFFFFFFRHKKKKKLKMSTDDLLLKFTFEHFFQIICSCIHTIRQKYDIQYYAYLHIHYSTKYNIVYHYSLYIIMF